jgi:hypothetical protein
MNLLEFQIVQSPNLRLRHRFHYKQKYFSHWDILFQKAFYKKYSQQTTDEFEIKKYAILERSFCSKGYTFPSLQDVLAFELRKNSKEYQEFSYQEFSLEIILDLFPLSRRATLLGGTSSASSYPMALESSMANFMISECSGMASLLSLTLDLPRCM